MLTKTKSLTVGSPGKLITSLALPLMLGNICQQLYTVTDTAVVGKFVGVEALASLGGADWLSWIILGINMGAAQGFGIVFAQRFGAQDKKGLKRGFYSALYLGAAIALLFTLLSELWTVPALTLMGTPENVIDGSILYLRIFYGGMIVSMAYNVFGTALSSLGNSRTPFVAMLIASSLNISLDLLFVLVFDWGIAGAASATVIAQCFSALFCLRALIKTGLFRREGEAFLPNKQDVLLLLSKSAPLAFQNTIIAVGGVAVQAAVNTFGYLFVAGFTASNKMYGVLEMAAMSFGNAACAYTAQNFGARKLRRVRMGMRFTSLLSVLLSAVVGGTLLLLGKPLLRLFMESGPNEAEVLQIAYEYLTVMCVPLLILYWIHMFRNTIQGLGNTWVPMISGVLELIMRVGSVLTLPALLGGFGIFIAEPLAWLGADLILIPAYFIIIKHLERTYPEVET